ncbi:MAG TPA: cytochrome c [Pirellulales bacterium]|nr:cytochrome c [Pirellulales bacterium]
MTVRFAICHFLLGLCALAAPGCDMLDMYDEPRFEPLEASTFFDDGTSARPLVAGTVARGDLREDEAFYSGKVDGKYVTELPVDVDRELLLRGQQRFNIYCSPCHGRVGDGRGMIVRRGFRQPPSFVSTDRLIDSPVGHFYDVITNGFGAMPSYASRVEPRDRWAIVAYIRALQRSQNGAVDDVPADLRDKIAESDAVQAQEREKREAAERLDSQRQQKLERDIREHRRSPEEGERKHREIEREKREERNDKQSTRASAENALCGVARVTKRLPPALAGGGRAETNLFPRAGFSRASRPTAASLRGARRSVPEGRRSLAVGANPRFTGRSILVSRVAAAENRADSSAAATRLSLTVQQLPVGWHPRLNSVAASRPGSEHNQRAHEDQATAVPTKPALTLVANASQSEARA